MMTLTDIELAEATALDPLHAEINSLFAADRREDGMAEAREVIQEQKCRDATLELIGELCEADKDFLRASIVEDWRKASAAVMRMHDIIYKLVALEP